MPNYFDRRDYDSDEEAIADGLFAIAKALHQLGNADASTPMGGLEALGAVIREGLQNMATAIEESRKE